MKVSEAFPSQYLKAADLNGRNVTLTIKNVDLETIGDDRKPVAYFEGKEKGLVLNKTNANTIAFAYGDDMDEWRGGEIIIFPTTTDFQGRTVDAIRVKIPPRKPAGSPTAQKAQDLDDSIPF
jgi:hypothetical protein